MVRMSTATALRSTEMKKNMRAKSDERQRCMMDNGVKLTSTRIFPCKIVASYPDPIKEYQPE